MILVSAIFIHDLVSKPKAMIAFLYVPFSP
jgi:hypothetical protein